MVISLKARLGLVFLAFFLLLSVSVAATWWAVEAQRRDAIRAIESLTADPVGQAEVAQRYEGKAALKIAQLRAIQGAFFAGALALLVAGFFLVQRSVVRPMQRLGLAVERIGGGDLRTPVDKSGLPEIQSLGGNLDAMRSDLAASCLAQQNWSEELEAKVAQRTHELVALREVSREISAQLDVRHVLQSVTDKARALLSADVAVLCLLDEPGVTLNLRAVSGPGTALAGESTSALHRPADRVLAADRALPCGAGECQGCCNILARPFLSSHLVASLHVGSRVIGALCVGGTTTGRFSGEGVLLLTELADSAAIALENARLYAQAERVAALEERQRIAAEMHDGVAQMVGYLGIQVDQAADLVAAGRDAAALEQLERLRGAADQASAEVRRAISSLQQDPQRPQSLQERLTRLVADPSLEGEPAVELDLVAHEMLPAQDVCEEVLRVVREALVNARRHAGARWVGVRLEQAGDEASVTIEDDGRGFDPAAPPAGDQHFGLSIMRARAARLGGRLTVTSEPGRGTRVELIWPAKGM